MNWDAIGAVGEIIGALAVFLTLAYLAIQIRQNTKTVQAAALDSSVNGISAIREKMIESAEVTDIFSRGNEDPHSLSEAELTRFRLLYTNIFWSGLNLYNQSKYAELSERIWECQRPIFLRILNTAGGKWYWTNYKNELEDLFVQEVDRIIENQQLENET